MLHGINGRTAKLGHPQVIEDLPKILEREAARHQMYRLPNVVVILVWPSFVDKAD